MTWIKAGGGPYAELLWHRHEAGMGERATTCNLILAEVARRSERMPTDPFVVCGRCKDTGDAGDRLEAHLAFRRAASAQELAAVRVRSRRGRRRSTGLLT